MATYDDDAGQLTLTIGVLGTHDTPLDVLTHMAVGTTREEIEAFPIVSFAFPPHPKVLDRNVVVHVSAIDQDIQWADAVIAVLTDDSATDDLFAQYGFAPVDDISVDELMSGAGGDTPVLGALVDVSRKDDVDLPEDVVRIDGDLADRTCVKTLVQSMINAAGTRLVRGESEPLPLPKDVHIGYHNHTEDAKDLGRVGMPKPGSRVQLTLMCHTGPNVEATGEVRATLGLHSIEAEVDAKSDNRALAGRWYVRLDREESFKRQPWLVRAMAREPIAS